MASIVDYLKSQGQDSSYNARANLAAQYGIDNYSGTSDQNISLLNMLQNGGNTQSYQSVATENAPKSIYDQQLDTLYANNQKQDAWMAEAKRLQEEQSKASTDYAVSEINRQKEQTDKDLRGEQTSAYVDYMKNVNPYGTNREQAVSQGLTGGYSESTQGKILNAYQTRVTTAQNTASQIKADYDAQINKAILEGNADLAEIAVNDYNQKMTNMWNSYQSEMDIMNSKQSYNQWLEEFNYQKQRDAVADSQWAKEYALSKQKASSSETDFTGDSTGTNNTSTSSVDKLLNSYKLLQNPSVGIVAKNSTNMIASDLTKRINNGEITREQATYILDQLGIQ